MDNDEKILLKILFELLLTSEKVTFTTGDGQKHKYRQELEDIIDELPIELFNIEDDKEVTFEFTTLLFNWLDISTSALVLNFDKYINESEGEFGHYVLQ